jgi:chromosome segregation ATPase
MSELEQERQFTNDNVTRFEENLRTRDAEIFQVTQRVLERESEVENLHEEMKSVEREYAHLINEQTRALRLATDQADESKARVDQLLRAKIEADVEVKTYRDRVIVLKEEVERLRRHVHSFQQESADKEVKIIHLTKQYSSGKEDLQGLNVVLDSKLQQLVRFIIFTVVSYLTFQIGGEQK